VHVLNVGVSHSVLSSRAVAATIGATHAVGAVTECTLLRRGQQDTYALRANGIRYVAKIYRADASLGAAAKYELEFLKQLESLGIPAAAPVLTVDGDVSSTVIAPEGLRHVALLRFVDGRPLQLDMQSSALYGQSIGRLHAAARKTSPGRPGRAFRAADLIDASVTSLLPFCSSGSRDEADLAAAARGITARIAEAAGDLSRFVCHGAPAGENVRLSRDARVTLLGFSHCGENWRGYDLAWCKRSLPGDHWVEFLRGYALHEPLSRADLLSVHVFEHVQALWLAALYAREAQYWGNDWFIDGAHLPSLLRRLRRWDAVGSHALLV
jgi:Ser/Thr protein kinase RdoA (MazF antagonist)